MKLLVIGLWPTRSNPISGIFVRQQVEAYYKIGCGVTVVSPQTVRSIQRDRPYHQVADKIDVFSPTYLDVPQAVAGGPWAVDFNCASFARCILRTLRRRRMETDFDGVHIHDVRYGGLSYPLWGRHISGPAILTLHGVDPFVAAKASLPWFARLLSNAWQDMLRVTLVGSPLSTYADNLGIPTTMRSIVPNGSELPGFWSTKQRPLTERRIVLSVSNLVKLKGIDLNLEALSRIYHDDPDLDWEYRIIGDGPEAVPLRALASRLGLESRVSFLGRIGHRETLAAIADCDVFSLPSWGENFGIVYLEAMGRGRPVIGCRGWGPADFIGDMEEGLLVEPHSVDALRLAMRQLLSSPELCSRLGASGRLCAEKFSWERNAAQYKELFSSSVPRSTQ